MNKGLYIHVPFCRRKCVYCDFYSLEGKEDRLQAYTDAVIRNIPGDVTFDTVYFGGGTPSLLEESQAERILKAADISADAEISAECNPDSADYDRLKSFREAGINRISFGIQSFDGRELEMLHRLHDPVQAENAIRAAQYAGFDNISADLMLGLPFQTERTVLDNIDRLASLGVTHVSAYMLKIEEGTPLAARTELISACADEDTSADYYLSAVSRLAEHGYEQYEISNFAVRGRECRHNLKYWRCEDYLGIGPSAHSCMDGKRFAVPADLEGFIMAEHQQTYVTDDMPCTAEEKMMLSLRLREGFDVSLAGEAADRVFRAAAPLEKHGLLDIKDGRISLTAKGFLVSNEIITILSEVL